MKCKYCGTKLDFLYWLQGLGECVSCQTKRWNLEWEKESRDSENYWKRMKDAKQEKSDE